MGRVIPNINPEIKLGRENLELFLSYDGYHGTVEFRVSDKFTYIFENPREWDDFHSLVSEFHELLHNKIDVKTI